MQPERPLVAARQRRLGPEDVALEKVVDRHPALVLHILAPAQDRGLVEGDRNEPRARGRRTGRAGAAVRRPAHRSSPRRRVSERACSGSPSARASAAACGPSAASAAGEPAMTVLRLMKSKTDSPL